MYKLIHAFSIFNSNFDCPTAFIQLTKYHVSIDAQLREMNDRYFFEA